MSYINFINPEKLIQVYRETNSIRKTGKYFGISHETVREYLHRLGECNKPKRFTCDDFFFARDTEESFYWAGFLAADGSINERGKNKIPTTIRLCLSVKDSGHIEKFAKSINFNGPIGYDDPSCGELRYYGLNGITSRQACKDLAERFNIVPRKTKIYTFPQQLINHPLISHYMRGYFDGDGSFYWGGMWQRKDGHNRTIKQVKFNLRGNTDFLNDYREILFKNCGVIMNPPRMNCGTPMIECGGNGVLSKICRFLYKDATIYLPRKYEYAKYAIDYRDEKETELANKRQEQDRIDFQRASHQWFTSYHGEINKESLQNIYNEYKTIADVADVIHKRYITTKELLLENGIEIINKYDRPELEKDNLIKLYEKYQSLYKMSEELNFSMEGIRKRLIKYGVDRSSLKRDKYDHAFFSEARESEIQFYMAGYLLGPCVIENKSNCIKITRTDKEILENIKKLNIIIAPKNIKEYNMCGDDVYRLSFYSKQMVSDLATRFGITDKKSTTYVFLEWLKEHKFLRHFIRGRFDSVGSLSKTGIEINGPIGYLDGLNEIFSKQLNIDIIKITKRLNKNSNRLVYCSMQLSEKIFHYLYDDCCISFGPKLETGRRLFSL